MKPVTRLKPAAYDLARADAEYTRLFRQLKDAFPDGDRVLVSRDRILVHLNRQMRLRTLGGKPILWTRVRRWAERDHFPLLPGKPGCPGQRYAALTTQYAVSAWILSRPRNGMPGLFAVWPTLGS